MRKQASPRRIRSRHYVARPWLLVLRPLLRFSLTRDAYVLRGIGNFAGPVLRQDRRRGNRRRDRYDGVERRSAQTA
jgi:hypothetical protein